jgi:C4-dicarboxylate-specific signal transduction histidine kinase
LNIFTNAKDALLNKNPQDRKVNVSSFSEKDNIIINIEDNAGGIDEAIIDKIFDPYFTTKDKNLGTGIGLYMSKMIIEKNMGGKLLAKNSKEGAVFIIILKKSEKC